MKIFFVGNFPILYSRNESDIATVVFFKFAILHINVMLPCIMTIQKEDFDPFKQFFPANFFSST